MGPEASAAIAASALEMVNVETGARRVVHRAEGKMEAPHFAPNGDALYYNHGGRIWRLRLEEGARPMTIETGFAVKNINDHGISPDGTRLAISDLTESGKSRIYVVPIEGGEPSRVETSEPAYWHGWSPDGKTLTYGAAREGNYDVYTVPVAGGPERRLTTEPGNENGPDYSADGEWIYYHSVRDGGVQIWRMRTDGSGQEQVTSDGYHNWFPHPSPDGKWVLVLSTKVPFDTGHPPDGEHVLRLLPAGGDGEVREIARFSGGNGSLNVPCWSRDGRWVAFASYTFGP